MFCKCLCLLLLMCLKKTKLAGTNVTSNVTGINSWRVDSNTVVQRNIRQVPGETKVNKGELPYHVSIQKVEKKDGDLNKAIHVCEGAIITEITVITSSVCQFQKYKFHDKAFDYYAAAGFASANDKKTMKKIKDLCMRTDSSFMFHYKQYGKNAVLSLSLVILEEKFEFKPNAIGPIDLANVTPDKNIACTLSAFKLKDNKYIEYLFKVDVEAMKCANQSGTDAKRKRRRKKYPIICTISVPYRIEGGPLVCNNKLVGVSYQNSPEDTNNTELYLSVGAQNQWIRKNQDKETGSDDTICDLHAKRHMNVLLVIAIVGLCFICLCLVIPACIYFCWHHFHTYHIHFPSRHH